MDSNERRSNDWRDRQVSNVYQRCRTTTDLNVGQNRLATSSRSSITSPSSSSSSSSLISIGQAALSSHVVKRTASDWLSARVSTPPRIPNARARSRGVGSWRGRKRGCEKERERARERKRERGLHPFPPWQNSLARTLPATNP